MGQQILTSFNVNQDKKEPDSSPSGGANTNHAKKGKGQEATKKIRQKRKTVIVSKKMQAQVESQYLESMRKEDNVTNSEADTFSQIIKIHAQQDELLDLEFFIKGVKEKTKFQKNDESGQEEEEIQATDSSDSEESVKKYFVNRGNPKSQFENQTNANNSNIQKPHIKIKKSKRAVIQTEKKDDKTPDVQFRSIESPSKIKQLNRRMTQIKGGNKQLVSLEGDKPITQKNNQPLSQEGTLDQYQLKGSNFCFSKKDNSRGASITQGLGFDKITHRKETSPSNLLQEFQNFEVSPIKSRVNASMTIKSFEEDKMERDNLLHDDHSAIMFKSYEELKYNIVEERQRIIPLYENPLYHQNRLNNSNNQIRSSSIKKGDDSASNHLITTQDKQQLLTQQQQINLRNISTNQYEPYEEYKASGEYQAFSSYNRQITNLSIKNEQSQNQSNFGKAMYHNIYHQMIPSPIRSGDNSILNDSHNINQTTLLFNKPEDLYTNRKQRYGNNKNGLNISNTQNQCVSMQRMSFKELLESSRLTRATDRSIVDAKHNNYIRKSINVHNNNANQEGITTSHNQSSGGGNPTHLLQILKNTYNRFQNQKGQGANSNNQSHRFNELNQSEFDDQPQQHNLTNALQQKQFQYDIQRSYFNNKNNNSVSNNSNTNYQNNTFHHNTYKKQPQFIETQLSHINNHKHHQLGLSSKDENADKKTISLQQMSKQNFNSTLQSRIVQNIQQQKQQQQQILLNQCTSNPVLNPNNITVGVPQTTSLIGLIPSQNSSIERIQNRQKYQHQQQKLDSRVNYINRVQNSNDQVTTSSHQRSPSKVSKKAKIHKKGATRQSIGSGIQNDTMNKDKQLQLFIVDQRTDKQAANIDKKNYFIQRQQQLPPQAQNMSRKTTSKIISNNIQGVVLQGFSKQPPTGKTSDNNRDNQIFKQQQQHI